MADTYHIKVSSGALVGIYTNSSMEGLVEVSADVFRLASEAMGKCPPDSRVMISEDFSTFSYVPFVYSPEDQKQVAINQARQYLAETDWYYARKAETGDEVPPEVVQNRKNARDFLRQQLDT